jgi:hypothetical protein
MAITYTPIATTTTTTVVGNVNFSSIPSTYTDLIIVVVGADNTDNTRGTYLRFNSDTGSNYSITELRGNGTSAFSTRAGITAASIAYSVTPDTTLGYSVNIGNIMNYANSTTFKTVLARENSLTTTYGGSGAIVSLWRNTAAITSIDVLESGNFKIGSTFSLYGIKSA